SVPPAPGGLVRAARPAAGGAVRAAAVRAAAGRRGGRGRGAGGRGRDGAAASGRLRPAELPEDRPVEEREACHMGMLPAAVGALSCGPGPRRGSARGGGSPL